MAVTIEDVKNSLDGVSVDVDFLEGIFNPNNLPNLSPGGALRELVKLIAKELAKLLEAFVDALENNANNLANVIKKIAEKIGEIWKAIIYVLQNAFDSLSLGKFPGALRNGPLASFEAAGELTSLLQSLGATTSISSRIDVVADSFTQLVNLAGGGGSLPIITQVVTQFKDLLKDVISGANLENKIRDRLVKLLVPDVTAVVEILRKASEGKWWAWAELPSGLVPGKLHQWINDPSTYPNDPQLAALARRFRCQTVMALDSCMRSHVAAHDVMTNSDRRMSYQALTDVISLLIDQVITFVFEPDDFPATEDDLDGLEDVGFGFATSAARQTRVAIRGLLGTLFRGAWEFSVHSDALIELFATVVGVTFSSIFEAVCRNLTWSLRLVSRYKGDPHGGAAGFVVAQSLDRTSPITGSGIAPQNIEYVVFVRHEGLTATPVTLGQFKFLRNILSDLAAYLDSAYLQFQKTKRLPIDLDTTDTTGLREVAAFLTETSQQMMEVKLFPRVATDEIGGVNFNLQGKTLRLTAQVLPIDSEFGNLPRPVVRAYFRNQVLVMAPGNTPTDDYAAEFTFKRLPRKKFKVTVLSSRGGIGETFVA